MNSGEILKRRADLLNSSRRNLIAAGHILDGMQLQNDFVIWNKDFRTFWRLLWKARRQTKKAIRLGKKYDKALKENN